MFCYPGTLYNIKLKLYMGYVIEVLIWNVIVIVRD